MCSRGLFLLVVGKPIGPVVVPTRRIGVVLLRDPSVALAGGLTLALGWPGFPRSWSVRAHQAQSLFPYTPLMDKHYLLEFIAPWMEDLFQALGMVRALTENQSPGNSLSALVNTGGVH